MSSMKACCSCWLKRVDYERSVMMMSGCNDDRKITKKTDSFNKKQEGD